MLLFVTALGAFGVLIALIFTGVFWNRCIGVENSWNDTTALPADSTERSTVLRARHSRESARTRSALPVLAGYILTVLCTMILQRSFEVSAWETLPMVGLSTVALLTLSFRAHVHNSRSFEHRLQASLGRR